MVERANLSEVQSCLSGIDFPKNKAELIDLAKSKNCSVGVVNTLQELRKSRLNNSMELTQEISESA